MPSPTPSPTPTPTVTPSPYSTTRPQISESPSSIISRNPTASQSTPLLTRDSTSSDSGSQVIDLAIPKEYFGDTQPKVDSSGSLLRTLEDITPSSNSTKSTNTKSDEGFWGGLVSGIASGATDYFSGGDFWGGLIEGGIGLATNYLQQDAVDQKREFDAEQSQADRDWKAEQFAADREANIAMNEARIAAAKANAALEAKTSLAREGMGSVSSLINTRANALGNRAANRTLTTNLRTLTDSLK